MKYAIEVLSCELSRLKRHIRIIENNQNEIMTNIDHTREERDVAEIEKAIERLQSNAELATTTANNARVEIAERLLKLWAKYWNHTADLTTAEAVDLQNETYSFINSSATSPVA